MLNSILGTKVGMTQVFTERGVVPVTVINVGNWFVIQIKTPQKDGYAALQVGLPRKKYAKQSFDVSWCKNKKKYFSYLREVEVEESVLEKISVGLAVKLDNTNLQEGNLVNVIGKSRGLGFQGVVKRWGFAGGPGSHGSNFHRKPGSIGNICSQGKVVKGKKLPGHTGNRRITISGLAVIKVDAENGYLYVKGAVPGKKDSLLTISKQG